MGLYPGGGTFIISNFPSVSVPSEGWKFNGDGQKLEDPGLTVTRGPLSVCDSVNLDLRGPALQVQFLCAGVYLPTGDWIAGHPGYKHSHQERYLCVGWGSGSGWRVQRSFTGNYFLNSWATAWCPADPRASRSLRSEVSSWRYYDHDGWKEVAVIVQCADHD